MLERFSEAENPESELGKSFYSKTWSSSTFYESFLTLVSDFSLEEFGDLVLNISKYLDQINEQITSKFKAVVLFPSFRQISANSSRNKWKQKLIKVLEEVATLDAAVMENVKSDSNKIIDSLEGAKTDSMVTELEWKELMENLVGNFGINVVENVMKFIKKHAVEPTIIEATVVEYDFPKLLHQTIRLIFNETDYIFAKNINDKIDVEISSGLNSLSITQILMSLEFQDSIKGLTSNKMTENQVLTHFSEVLAQCQREEIEQVCGILERVFQI